MRKKALIALAASIVLVLTAVLTGSATVAQTARTYTCLSPRNESGEPRIAFTGTLEEAKEFYERTVLVESLGNVPIAEWTDGLPVIVPTEQKVIEMLTGTSHSASEVLSVYTKNASGQWVKGTTPSAFQPSGNTATVEQVAVNAVMAGAKPEYMPAILAMMSGGPNYVAEAAPIGYYQIVSGPYAKEVGFNAGQGAMNPGNPPSMTIGRSFTLCMINLGGAMAGSTNVNVGNMLTRSELCFAEDGEALPGTWVGMNEDVGYDADESVIMLCAAKTQLYGNNAPSSFRSLNSGHGGIARKLELDGVTGYHNWIEYIMQLQLMTDTTTNNVSGNFAGELNTGPMVFVMCPDMALSLYNHGFKSKADFYKWVEDRCVIPLADYQKYGWYDALTNNGTAIEPTSGKPYNQLTPDYPVHVMGMADEQLAIISIYPGDEFLIVHDGGRGITRCIDPWR